jgi:glycosyltransferase involved in cell wall biosynthesis
MSSISACIACRNEEGIIERCLRSIYGVVDEIVLVHDGPCDDRTLEIAKGYGCRVVVGKRTGSGTGSLPTAFELANGEWLLSIDADEFLSEELRSSLQALVAREDVHGWEFLWPLWNGREYISERGPYKLVLARRSRTRLLGVPHSPIEVRGRVKRSQLRLEHQPQYNNFNWSVFKTKWRAWAKLQARGYLSDWSTILKFGYGPDAGWSARRVWANRLSPVLFLPYGAGVALQTFWHYRSFVSVRWNLRLAGSYGLYVSMVQFYVARFSYLPWDGPDSLVD